MVNFPKSFSEVDKINYLQRKVILLSIAYYIYNRSFVPDAYFDEISHQLVKMQQDYDKENKENEKDEKGNHSVKSDTEYGYMMFDFEGSTGFDLYPRLKKKDQEYLVRMVEYKIARSPKEDE